MTTLIQQLHKARTRSGKTLRDVAQEVGLQAIQISQIENGKISPTLRTLEKLAGCYGKEIILTDKLD